MGKSTPSLRLERALLCAKTRVTRFESDVGKAAWRKRQLQAENGLPRSFRRLEAFWSNSLEVQDRLSLQLSLCDEKTLSLEAQMLVFEKKVSALAKVAQDLEDKKMALKSQFLRREKSNYELEPGFETTGKLLQSHETEPAATKGVLKSEKMLFQEETAKSTRNSSQVSATSTESKRSKERRKEENLDILNFIESRKVEVSAFGKKTIEDEESCHNFGHMRLEEIAQKERNVAKELEYSEGRPDCDIVQNTLSCSGFIETSIRNRRRYKPVSDNLNSVYKTHNDTQFLYDLTSMRNDFGDNYQGSNLSTTLISFNESDVRNELARNETQFATTLSEVKKGVKKRDSEVGKIVPVLGGSFDEEQATQQDDNFVDTFRENSVVERENFQRLIAHLEAKSNTCCKEGNLFELDFMRLRANISLLESYVNLFVDEKRQLLGELSETKQNDDTARRIVDNTSEKPFSSASFNSEVEKREETVQIYGALLDTLNDVFRCELCRKLQSSESDVDVEFSSINKTEKIHENPAKLRTDWVSVLESYLNKLTPKRSKLLFEAEGIKRCDPADQENFMSSCFGNAEVSKGNGLGFPEDFGGEIKKLWDIARDLQTKYTTCKTELERQRKLISRVVTREESTTRWVHDITREFLLKLKALLEN